METVKKKKSVTFQIEANKEMIVYQDSQCSKSLKRKKTGETSGSMVVKSPAMERAEEIIANLPPGSPTLVKLMQPSHVAGGFWLGLNRRFCDSHMPNKDAEIILEDEKGEKFKTKFLKEKTGLSGGWRGFSIAHNLMENDVLVFRFVKPTKCKVYIVRANNLDEVDGVLGLLNLEASIPQIEYELDAIKETKPDVQIVTAETDCDDKRMGEVLEAIRFSDGKGMGEVLEAIRFSDDTVVDFNDVNDFESFTVSVHGLVIDSEVSIHVRRKYYELCNSQNMFLHEHLIEGLNCKLAAGIITETVNISEAIRASRVSTSPEHFEIWDKTLKAFEDMGMNIRFLRAKLDKLLGIGFESRKCTEESLRKVAEANEQMRILQERLWEVKEAAKRVDAEIDKLTVTAEKHDTMFRQEVTASW